MILEHLLTLSFNSWYLWKYIINRDREQMKHRIDTLDQIEDKLTHSHALIYQNSQYLNEAFFALKAKYNNGKFWKINDN